MYFNMSTLRDTDVSTILVVRACCPLVNCIVEHFFLGKALPSRESFLMLCVVAMSAAAYAITMDHHPQPGYLLLICCYFVFICASDTFGKWIVSGLQWENKQWGPVLHQNTLSIPYQLMIAVATSEQSVLLHNVMWNAYGVAILALSCVLGLALSYFGWRCRDTLSATSFALLGVSNKLLSLLAAALIWEPPNLLSTGFLIVCLAAAMLYPRVLNVCVDDAWSLCVRWRASVARLQLAH